MLKIKTELFKELLGKAINGCSFNKMIPITGLLSIEVKDGILTLYSTDKKNYLKVSQKVEEDVADFTVVIDARLFNDLVVKTTSEYISMEFNKQALYIEGNGNYFLEIPVDENGEMIKFPVLSDIRGDKEGIEIDLKTFRGKLSIAKAALPITLESKEMNNYYIKDRIITSDVYKVSSLENIKELKNETLFFSRDFGDLILAMDYPKCKVLVVDNKIQFYNDNFVILGEIDEMFDKYPIEGIKSYLDTPFNNNVDINRKDILEILDRLTLFVSVFDRSTIKAKFTKDGVEISSRKGTGKEFITYSSKIEGEFKEFDCIIDIEYLKNQLDAQTAPVIKLHFGVETCIKLTSEEVIQIISLSDSEEE